MFGGALTIVIWKQFGISWTPLAIELETVTLKCKADLELEENLAKIATVPK